MSNAGPTVAEMIAEWRDEGMAYRSARNIRQEEKQTLRNLNKIDEILHEGEHTEAERLQMIRSEFPDMRASFDSLSAFKSYILQGIAKNCGCEINSIDDAKQIILDQQSLAESFTTFGYRNPYQMIKFMTEHGNTNPVIADMQFHDFVKAVDGMDKDEILEFIKSTKAPIAPENAPEAEPKTTEQSTPEAIDRTELRQQRREEDTPDTTEQTETLDNGEGGAVTTPLTREDTPEPQPLPDETTELDAKIAAFYSTLTPEQKELFVDPKSEPPRFSKNPCEPGEMCGWYDTAPREHSEWVRKYEVFKESLTPDQLKQLQEIESEIPKQPGAFDNIPEDILKVSLPAEQPANDVSTVTRDRSTDSTHTVQKGEALSIIVQEKYDTDPDNPMSWTEIKALTEIVAKESGIAKIDEIDPGDKIVLPEQEQLTAIAEGRIINGAPTQVVSTENALAPT